MERLFAALSHAVESAPAIALLLAYGLGHCSIIILAGTSTELVQRYLDWTERSKGPLIVKRFGGVLVLVAGLYVIYKA